MIELLSAALQGALGDVVTRILRGDDLADTDLYIFRGRFGPEDEIMAYLTEASGGKIVAGDSRLFATRFGSGVYCVYLPDGPTGPLRPEYQPGARCLYVAAAIPGVFDCRGPASKERLAVTCPHGVPSGYVLPDWASSRVR